MSKIMLRQSEFATYDDGTLVVNRDYINLLKWDTFLAISIVAFAVSGLLSCVFFYSAPALAYYVFCPGVVVSVISMLFCAMSMAFAGDLQRGVFLSEDKDIFNALAKSKTNGGKSVTIGDVKGVTFNPETKEVLSKAKDGNAYIVDSSDNKKLVTHQVRESLDFLYKNYIFYNCLISCTNNR